MYHLIGSSECIKNVVRLVHPREASTIPQLRGLYVDFLVRIAGEDLRPESKEGGQATFSDERISRLLTRFHSTCAITDMKTEFSPTPSTSRYEATDAFLKAIGHFEADDPALITFFRFFIHTVFYQRSAISAGGSVSSALGVIWISNRKNWSQHDLVEFMLHEMVHTLVFLDELAHGHYLDMNLIGSRDNWAESAILNRQRPLDKAFHSLIVATEILLFRQAHSFQGTSILHPESERLYASALDTARSIRSRVEARPLVQSRFTEILDKVCLTLEDSSLGEPRRRAA